MTKSLSKMVCGILFNTFQKMLKQIYELLTDSLVLPVDPILEMIIFGIVGAIVHEIAYNGSPGGSFGSIIYWVIKSVVFVVIWIILRIIIAIIKFIVYNWFYIFSGIIFICSFVIRIYNITKLFEFEKQIERIARNAKNGYESHSAPFNFYK